MLHAFELPIIFRKIDEDGIIKKEEEDFVYRRKKTFESTGKFESWSEELERIHSEEGTAEAVPFAKWREELGQWTMLPSSKVAFCTVSLQRENGGSLLNHCVVLLFWKDAGKMEIFDARGSDMSKYPSFPNFYRPDSLRLFGKAILKEWQLLNRMHRESLPTLDFLEHVPEIFLQNSDKCRDIGIFYVYTRLSTYKANEDYAANKKRAIANTLEKFYTHQFDTHRRKRGAASKQRRIRRKIQLRL